MCIYVRVWFAVYVMLVPSVLPCTCVLCVTRTYYVGCTYTYVWNFGVKSVINISVVFLSRYLSRRKICDKAYTSAARRLEPGAKRERDACKDDCTVFSEASQRGAAPLQEILNTYSRGSGQLVNKYKSAVFFSNNCADEAKNEV